MKFRNLAIFSDCVHYFDREGNVVNQNPVFCKQMQALAGLFENVVMYCPFDEYQPGIVATKYTATNISFYPLPKVGGNGIKVKLKILSVFPAWFRAYAKANREADIVYQRFPNNLNIPGSFYFWFKNKPVFASYTGTWDDYEGEPFSFRFQKWFLKKYFRGPVALYSRAEFADSKLFKSFSPSYTDAEWQAESEFLAHKIAKIKDRTAFMPVFLTAGALVKSKNQQYILDTFLQLHKEGFDFKLYIAGDGVLKASYQSFIEKNQLGDKIILAGNLNETEMKVFYRKADFVVQASLIEGYGKIPIEGFFYGVVPILHDVSLASEITGQGKRGFLYDARFKETLLLLIKKIYLNPKISAAMAETGRAYVRDLTVERWKKDWDNVLKKWFE